MKEVKEQCEERIEEVTKKGNEAAASKDLSEKKDQGQQVLLGFSAKSSRRYSYTFFWHSVPCLLSDLLCSALAWRFGSLRQNSLVPGCWDSDGGSWPPVLVLVLRVLLRSLHLKHTAPLGEDCCCFPVFEAASSHRSS